MRTSKKTAAAERALQTNLLAAAPANALAPSAPDELKAEPELPAEGDKNRQVGSLEPSARGASNWPRCGSTNS